MALTFTVVKRFKPQSGVRRGLVNITFDTAGPTWTVAKADLKLPGGIFALMFMTHPSGYVLNSILVAGNQTITIDSRKETGNAGAMGATTASDLNTLVARAEYIGW